MLLEGSLCRKFPDDDVSADPIRAIWTSLHSIYRFRQLQHSNLTQKTHRAHFKHAMNTTRMTCNTNRTHRIIAWLAYTLSDCAGDAQTSKWWLSFEHPPGLTGPPWAVQDAVSLVNYTVHSMLHRLTQLFRMLNKVHALLSGPAGHLQIPNTAFCTKPFCTARTSSL